METVTHPGATEELVVPILESANCSHLKVSRNTGGANDLFVGISPERLDLGIMTADQCDVPKVVSGVDRFGAELTSDLYGKVFKRIIRVSSTLTAEVVKLLESTYQCVNIALLNELKQACLAMGVDPWEVIATASTKQAGFQALLPGPGVGGPHIPFDCFSISRRAMRFGVRTKLIELAGEINRDMPRLVVRGISEAFNRLGKSIKGSNILVLGLTYERDSNDLYESPSLIIIELLRRAGAEVHYNDPFVPYIGRANHTDFNMTSASMDDLTTYDAVLIATDHSSYNYAQIVSRARLVIDTRNATRGMKAANIVLC
jgi:UDP-N-acetyl-D-glucosamine dehydrogenase